jgi:hypothetical protein
LCLKTFARIFQGFLVWAIKSRLKYRLTRMGNEYPKYEWVCILILRSTCLFVWPNLPILNGPISQSTDSLYTPKSQESQSTKWQGHKIENPNIVTTKECNILCRPYYEFSSSDFSSIVANIVHITSLGTLSWV